MDPIQRRLRLLDEHILERESLFEYFIGHNPLVFAALGMIAGIAIAATVSLPLWVWLCFIIISTGTCVFFASRTTPAKRIILLGCLAFFSFLALGAVRLICFNNPPADDITSFVSEGRKMATVRGTIISDIRVEDRDNWKFGRFLPLSPGSSFYLQLSEVKTLSGWSDVSGKVRVQVSGRVEGVSAGEKVEIYCWLSGFGGAANDGQFDMAKYMKRKGVSLGASVYSPAGVKPVEGNRPVLLTKFRYRLKTIANQALFSESPFDGENFGLLAALLLGTRHNIDTETYEAFRKTGLSHFISLSGMHMGILACLIWGTLRHMGLGKTLRAFVCIFLILLYVLIIPPRAPTLRAAIICWFFFVSVIVRKKPNSLNTLSLAAIVLLLFHPASLFGPGWQLSFSCVAGIILGYKHIEEFLRFKIVDRIDFLNNSNPNRIQDTGIWIVNYSVSLLSAGLSAWVAGSGIMLYHFGTITPLASLWTVLVFPVIFAILIAGYFKIIFSLLLPTLSMGLGFVLNYLCECLIAAVKFISNIELSQLIIGKVPLIIIAAFYAFIILLRFWHTDRVVLKKAVLYSLAIAVVLPLAIIKLNPNRRSYLEITCLDVGHGQALVAMLPNGENILFDAGSLTTKNCGAGIVVPFLHNKGIGKLHTIIASHDDIDHINGIPEIVSRYKTPAVYANGAILKEAESSSKVKHLKKCLQESGSSLRLLDESFNCMGNTNIRLLWPTAEVCGDGKVSINNKSQVSLIEFAGRTILICSDIEIFAQSAIFEMYPELTADIVVMPHHGSTSNLLDGFVERLEAKTVLISCAEKRLGNAWKSETGVKAYYTASDGAITIRVSKDGTIETKTFNEAQNKRTGKH